MSNRKILEASSTGDKELQAYYQHETHKLAGGNCLVLTDQPLGAIAVYLCEAGSDDGIVACGLGSEPVLGAEFPVLRVIEPLT